MWTPMIHSTTEEIAPIIQEQVPSTHKH
uniref:Uncharacterized protein n=1 Tax=Anguilla anguilla TaxID=7936 RepID=A0A0E9R2W8_ANGAN